MKKKKLLITETENFNQKTLNELNKKFNVIFGVDSQQDMITKLKNVEYLHVRLKYFLGEKLLIHSKDLRVITTPTTGLNHIDCDYLRKNKINLLSLRNFQKEIKNITATAELTIGLILNLTRNISQAVNHVKNKKWNRKLFLGNDLFGKTLGIIGYGRVGKILARIAKSFKMNVLHYDIIKSRSNSSIINLCKLSDIISLHIDYNEKNYHFFDEKLLCLMKKNSLLINTSRGEVLNHDHLLDFLERKKISGVALDVLENEHMFSTKLHEKLISYVKNNEDLIITPHICGYTEESLQKVENLIFRKLLRSC